MDNINKYLTYLTKFIYYIFYSKQNKYGIDVIDINNIIIDDIKYPNNSNLSIPFNFKFIENVFTNLTFIYYDEQTKKYFYKKKLQNNLKCLIEIIILDKSDESQYNNIHYKQNLNRLASYILSDISFLNILLPIINFDLIDYPSNLLPDEINLDKNIHSSPKCNVHINVFEYYSSTKPFNLFLKRNYNKLTNTDWGYLLIQCIAALNTIKLRYKDFKHNYCNMNSIKVMKLKEPIKLIYMINNKKLTLITKYIVKISDFDYSYINENFSNIESKHNEYIIYDLFDLIKDLYKYLDSNKISNNYLTTLLNSIISKNFLDNNKYFISTLNDIIFKNKKLIQFITYNNMIDSDYEDINVRSNTDDNISANSEFVTEDEDEYDIDSMTNFIDINNNKEEIIDNDIERNEDDINFEENEDNTDLEDYTNNIRKLTNETSDSEDSLKSIPVTSGTKLIKKTKKSNSSAQKINKFKSLDFNLTLDDDIFDGNITLVNDAINNLTSINGGNPIANISDNDDIFDGNITLINEPINNLTSINGGSPIVNISDNDDIFDGNINLIQSNF